MVAVLNYTHTMLARHALLRTHKKRAEKACRGIRQHCARPPLSASLVRQVRDYCGDVLGSTSYAPSMQVYALLQGEFREGWITDDYFELQVIHNTIPSPIYAQRTLNVPLFGAEGMPEVAYLINGHWFTPAMELIAAREVRENIFATTAEVYIKAEGSGRGNGTARTDRDGFAAALARISPDLRRNAVVQPHVTPHKWFRDIHEAAVGTLRLTTVLTDEAGPVHRGTVMRFAQGADQFLLPASTIKLGVSLADGTLGDHAYNANFQPFAAHPDSGVVFKGAQIPHFAKAVAFCRSLHRKLPHFQIIGWDVVITDAGAVMLLEWNGGHCGVAFNEAITGPIFRGCNF